MGCYRFKSADGTWGYMCGDLGDHCENCGTVSDILCDYPVGDGKTCDRKLCELCAKNIAPNIDYCESHYEEWMQFKLSGGMKRELENVVPFKAKP